MGELSQNLVSVIIPVYNGEKTIRRAIDSVLMQEGATYEVIVVNDGSTDSTASILAGYGDAIRVIHQRNHGLPATRNRGIAESRGEFLAFLDADDEWLPGKLRHQLEVFAANSDVALVGTGSKWLDEDGRFDRFVRTALHGDVFRRLLYSNPINASSVMLRRSCLLASGLSFNTNLKRMDDWELWIRLSVRYPLVVSPQVLVCHYSTAEGETRKDPPRLLGLQREVYPVLFNGLLQDAACAATVKREWNKIQGSIAFHLAVQQYGMDARLGRREVWRLTVTSPGSVRWRTALTILLLPPSVRNWARSFISRFGWT